MKNGGSFHSYVSLPDGNRSDKKHQLLQDFLGVLNFFHSFFHSFWWLCQMWVKQCHKLPMTGNGKHTTYKHGDLGDGLLFCPS
jgi:hypothetical protein